MIKFIILSFLLSISICKQSVNYLTWSLENGTDFLKDGIALWKIKPLEFARVEQGKGDVKIYFKNPPANYSYIEKFDKGRENISQSAVFYVLQHDHTLGYQNKNNSITFLNFNNDTERQKALKLNECRFDSVALINYQTYLVFSGSYYKRLDIYTSEITRDKVWHPFLIIVDAMYRNSNGNYILISNKEFFEFNSQMKFVRQGFIESLFPYVPYVDSVLKLRNGTTVVFSNLDVYKDDQKIVLDILKIFSGSVRGAFELLDGSIQLIDKHHVWTFDRNFNYKNRSVLCETKYFSSIHCC